MSTTAPGGEHVPAKDSATVLLLRPAATGHGGVEVFMQQRALSMAFAAGMATFPGGSVDPSDHVGTQDWIATAAGDLDEPDHVAGPAATAPVTAAAIRETFEECGVLLARDGGPHGATQGPTSGLGRVPHSAPARGELRAALSEHRLGVADALDVLGMAPHTDQLHYVDRWITPEGLPRRYDTRFIAASVPPGQEPENLSTESVRSFWIKPVAALDAYATGELDLMQPTWAQLRRLAAARTLDQALLPARTGVTRNVLVEMNGHVVPWGAGTEDFLASGPLGQ
ncbi:NUDIX hydrolase [Galactobacter sp.]|uniref:NUDIX hydrolase n=1 Tax=Galactobacter sp. TaxID=2676125 RepID=UPI0025BE1307|nr:NUDIX hydrolase [Galactobacter sp.]